MSSSDIPHAPLKVEIDLRSALADHEWTRAADLMEAIADAGNTVDPFTLKLLADYMRPKNRPDRYKVKQGQGANAIKRIMIGLEDKDVRNSANHGMKGNERQKLVEKYKLSDVRSLDNYRKEARQLIGRLRKEGHLRPDTGED
jgi:hypothetical protein